MITEKPDNISKSAYYYTCHGSVDITFNKFWFLMERSIIGFIINYIAMIDKKSNIIGFIINDIAMIDKKSNNSFVLC